MGAEVATENSSSKKAGLGCEIVTEHQEYEAAETLSDDTQEGPYLPMEQTSKTIHDISETAKPPG